MVKVLGLLSLCFLMLMVYAVPLGDEKESEARILNSEYTMDELGYRYSFETSNRITRREEGTIINKGQPDEFMLIVGRYTYFDPEGEEQVVEYTADDNGYKISVPTPIDQKPTVAAGVPANVVASLLGG